MVKKIFFILIICFITIKAFASSADFIIEISIRQDGVLKSLVDMGLSKEDVSWTLYNGRTKETCVKGTIASGESWVLVPGASTIQLNMSMFDAAGHAGWKGGDDLTFVMTINKPGHACDGLSGTLNFKATTYTGTYINALGQEAGVIINTLPPANFLLKMISDFG